MDWSSSVWSSFFHFPENSRPVPVLVNPKLGPKTRPDQTLKHYMQRPFAPPPRSTIHPESQCLGRCNGGFISPASRSNAGSALGHGKCSAHDWQHLPSSIHVNTRGSNSLCVYAGLHNCARLAVLFTLQCSPHAGLFSICAGASIVSCGHPCSIGHTSPSYHPTLAM